MVVAAADSRDGRFSKDPFLFDSIGLTGALLSVTSLISYSFNTAFMNCESVNCDVYYSQIY